MKTWFRRLKLEWELRGMRKDLDLLYRERRMNQIAEEHTRRQMERARAELLRLDLRRYGRHS